MHKSHAGHVLPEWFEWWQDHVVLSLLVIANMILGGLMFSTGIVRDIETPQEWGHFHTIIFIAFFAAGTGLAGVVLRASAGFIRAARAGWGRVWEALLNLLVIALFLPIEIWASLTQRSTTRVFTPADTWALEMIGHPDWPISPTVLALAVAGPLILAVWGIVTRNAEDEEADYETDEERATRERRELAEAEHKARLARVKAQHQAITALGVRGAVEAALRGRDTTFTHATDTPPEDFPPTPTTPPRPSPADEDAAERGTDSGESFAYMPSIRALPTHATTRKRAAGKLSREQARWLQAKGLLDGNPAMSAAQLREILKCRNTKAQELYTRWQIERRKQARG